MGGHAKCRRLLECGLRVGWCVEQLLHVEAATADACLLPVRGRVLLVGWCCKAAGGIKVGQDLHRSCWWRVLVGAGLSTHRGILCVAFAASCIAWH